MPKLLRNILPKLTTVLSAILIVLAFPEWDFYPLAWICLVPWFFSISSSRSWKIAVREGLWFSFFMSLGGFYWVAYSIHQYGNLPWIIAIPMFLLFSFFCQPQFWVFAPIYRTILAYRARDPRPSRLLLTSVLGALAYAGIDRLIPKLFVDSLGHAFYEATYIRQIADLGGPYLLTFLAFLVNDAIYLTVSHFKNRDEPSWMPSLSKCAPLLTTAIALMSAAFFYGRLRDSEWRTRLAEPAKRIHIGVIQANIGDFDKIAAERGYRGAAEKVVGAHLDLSETAIKLSPRPDALVWAETAYPSTFRNPNSSADLKRQQIIEAFVKQTGLPLLFGGYDTAEGKDYNALFYLSPQSLLQPGLSHDLQSYRKHILLLFGEYIPLSDQIAFIRQQFPQVGNFGQGRGPEVLQIPTKNALIPTSPAICYEVLFSQFILEGVRLGSRLILNVTNDSWFGPRGEPYLHLALSTFRSIETRTPLLRATNTGISALVLPSGEISQRTGVFTQEILHASVPILPRTKTLMLALGDWFGYFAFALGLGGLAVLLRRDFQLSKP